ncbi:MAG: flagellar export chaperone FlgN [Planctomycetes bacterium]|nr:flagellar export chaperone FlgN [Planctomycetota bacterium]
MNDAAAHREANALAQILDQLSALHASMTEVISRKIEQMRRADMEGMRDSAAKEQALLERINERDGLRRQVTDRLGKSLGMSAGRVRAMTARQLAEKIGPPVGDQILGAAQTLRVTLNKLAVTNRTAGAISGKIVEHLHGVFAAMSGADADGAEYERGGRVGMTSRRQLFEAVG